MITITDVEGAIVEIYDVHVELYGYDRDVFFVATTAQVAQYLGVKNHHITNTVKEVAPWGYAKYKHNVLARAGRGRVVESSHIYWFEPNVEDIAQ